MNNLLNIQTNGPKEIFIQSLADFFSSIHDDLQIKNDVKTQSNKEISKLFWFRGQANFNHHLVPSLYRNFDFDKDHKERFWKNINEWEKCNLRDFKTRNYHLLSRLPEENLSWFSIMQHYGTPTRFLDWSQNALASFFFALEKFFSKENNCDAVLPCVWRLEPLNLLKKTKIYKMNIEMDVIPDIINGYRKINKNEKLYYFSATKNTPSWPLPILAHYNNERIKFQSGTFTLFPILENVAVEKGFNSVALDTQTDVKDLLTRYIILKPERISKELKTIGVKRSMFYPEMPDISIEIEQDMKLNYLHSLDHR
jgi:hypothetical protein